ncbi:unnamed protein product [Porites lobata]|uniref:Phospholipase A2-like domain-containing protein n=1 Tax=Porites lobata TaxID=104759 RepID=A0ABN8PFH6_9CNID|nr:unnamed protein product [Porites lobata]
MGRYVASELMRNRELQRKAVNYGINKLTPLIQDSVGTALDELSTKVRPKKEYKTDRKDLDGRGIDPITVVKKAPDVAMKTTQELIPSLKPVYDRYKSGDIFKSAFGSEHGITSSRFWRRPTAAEEKAKGIIRKGSNPELFFAFHKDGKKFRKYKTKFFEENPEALTDINNIISSYPDTWPDIIKNKYGINIDEHFWENNPLLSFGSGVDIHKWIGKLPRPKGGWTAGKYKYMGPYNPLEEQLSYDPNTGEVTEWKVKPYNRVDEIAADHDICYDMGRNKGDCDREMVQSLDEIPYADEIHKPITRNFQKRTVVTNGIDAIWAADLVEMQRLVSGTKVLNIF